MKVKVRTVSGQTIEIDDVNPDGTVADLKASVATHESVTPDLVRLIFSGRELGNDELLSAAGLHNDSTIHMVIRQRPAAPTGPNAPPDSPGGSASFVAVPVIDQTVGRFFGLFLFLESVCDLMIYY
uniref:Ubiquitin-like domain-containing protein n=1 Tax=Spongospora subterranea TaxID=70186 RepID=A0A0H5QPV8_9EUKA|eukprot:CRZ04078.1 hypothetical protein [Spongospora subterranea]